MDGVGSEIPKLGVEPDDLRGQLLVAAGHAGPSPPSPSSAGHVAGPEPCGGPLLLVAGQPGQLLPQHLVGGGTSGGITGVHESEIHTGVRVTSEESFAGDPVEADVTGMQSILTAHLSPGSRTLVLHNIITVT
jgi:hypothetical protein